MVKDETTLHAGVPPVHSQNLGVSAPLAPSRPSGSPKE